MFYIRYALRNILRGGRWTGLAVLCIAAGVATVVALRSLGLAIGESLLDNVRIDNKGDLRVVKGSSSQFAALVPNDDRYFSAAELVRLTAWTVERGGRLSAFKDDVRQVAPVGANTVGRPSFISTFYIDPATYPPNYTIYALDPAGVPLQALFTGGNEIVISDNMAQTQGIRVGDSVTVSGTDQPFVVRGIVDSGNEAGIRNLFASFFGFAYISLDVAQATIRDTIRPNNVAIALASAPQTEGEYRRLEAEVRALGDERFGRPRIDTTYELLRRNDVIAEVLSNFIVVLGLGALLIGGVGIMNTMLVMVRRRTNEIAALKTFGLKSGQIGRLFFVEGLLLGLLGSMLGALLGVLLGGVVNQYGETFLQQDLPWRVYPQALAYGFVLGLLTTAVFSLAPILTALQVRPAQILRPNDVVLPRLGCLQTILLMLVVTLALGLIVGQIVSPTFNIADENMGDGRFGSAITPATPYISGVLGVAATLALLGVLVVLLWWVVYLIGKLPSFGQVRLRLALRNLSHQRVRTATTILALATGMFVLSVITFVGEGTRQLLELQLTRQAGGNVLAFPVAPSGLAGAGALAIDLAVANAPGILHRTTIGVDQAPLVAIDGVSTRFDPVNEADKELAAFVWGGLLVRESTNPRFYDEAIEIVAGRNLTPEDRGKRVAVVPYESAQTLGVQIGSRLTYSVNGIETDFEVIGMAGGAGGGGFFGTGGISIPPGSLGRAPLFTLYSFQVEPEHVNQVLVALSSIRIPPTYAVDVAFIDALASRFIDQFAAIPTVVGILSLVSAGVIMANTVALATLERRRQMGVLKAIGLKGRSVLQIMLIETMTITLTSALLGLLVSSLFLALLTALTQTPIPLPVRSQVLVLALLLVAALIGAVATFLSANLAVRERVMNVLRYD
jgi:ABC-type antimicrobial peptide transport system permease subunit